DQLDCIWFPSTDATSDSFVEHAPNNTFVLLETHSTFDRYQPFLSRLLFALSSRTAAVGSTAQISRSPGTPMESFTIMDALAKLTFRMTELLILVSCESDRTHDFSLNQAGISISEAMLCKGVERVIATKWLVDPCFSRNFMKEFMDIMKIIQNPLIALAEMQRNTARKKFHPGYWAAFSFSGKPGFVQFTEFNRRSLTRRNNNENIGSN
ncbi:CHAT domain-containing protein, partial [bacterium]|nr:CHAT domain-containing protein [bacterium]